MTTEEFTQLCKDLEHFETPEWAAARILEAELLGPSVVDPCAGSGILAAAAFKASGGAHIEQWDIHRWGPNIQHVADFLSEQDMAGVSLDGFTVFMNPPFSRAEAFVEQAMRLGARKVICFQRFAWWESRKRRAFWDQYPPNRVYICGERADCWRHDIPHDQRGSSTPTAHAWFVWERGQPPGTLLGHIYKENA